MNLFLWWYSNLYIGRADRSDYWIAIIANFAAKMLLLYFLTNFNIVGLLITLPFWGILTITATSVMVKRLHDTNRSGWHILLLLLPPIAVIYFTIVCGFLKGNEGSNKYGDPPTNLLSQRSKS